MLSSSPEGKVEVHFGQQGLKALREAADAKGNGFSNWIGKKECAFLDWKNFGHNQSLLDLLLD